MKSRSRLLSILLILTMVISLSGNKVPEGGSVFMSRAHASQEISAEPAGADPVEIESVEAGYDEIEPAEAKSVKTEPAEAESVETEPAEVESVETESAEMKTAETGSVEIDPAEDESADADPVQTDPAEAEPAEEEPVQTDPEEAEPAEDGDLPVSGADRAEAPEEEEPEVAMRDPASGEEDPVEADTLRPDQGAPEEDGVSEDSAGGGSEADAAREMPGLEEQTLSALIDWGILYDDEGYYYESTDRVNPVSEDLLGRIPQTVWDHDRKYRPGAEEVTVSVTGLFPQGVTARASCIPFEEDGAYTERALMALDILLYDADGNLFVPQGEITVTLGGSRLKKVIRKGQPVLAYLYEENTAGSGKSGLYEADVTVYRDMSMDNTDLLYMNRDDRDRDPDVEIHYFENLYGLTFYTDDTVDLYADTAPLHFLITARDESVQEAGEDESQQTEGQDQARADGSGEAEEAEETPGENGPQETDEADRAPERKKDASGSKAAAAAAGAGSANEAAGSDKSRAAADIHEAGATAGETINDAPRSAGQDSVLTKELTLLDGNRATWTISVNPEGLSLDEGRPLTLTDTFTDSQSIDYSSIQVTAGVTYDYSGRTGTYVIPDGTPVTISYRTRIAARPGEVVDFGNTARLTDASAALIDEDTVEETRTIYPSASDVDASAGQYMVRLFVYADANMQTGIPGVEFYLLDANQRPITYRKGPDAGQPVMFTTGESGYAEIRLDEEEGGVGIHKNTAYYLEMIMAPEGYRKDSTLYNFMITDDPGYESGGFWTYHNNDTIKVRLYMEDAGLEVNMRLSGNYTLNQDQQNGINVILQKKSGENWVEVERHSLAEFTYNQLMFDTGRAESPFEVGASYRVIEENERPWDLDSAVQVTTTYYFSAGAAEYERGGEPFVFTVTDDNVSGSFDVLIDNEYEEYKLTVTKMDKETGERLPGAVYTVRKAADDSVVTEYTTDEDGLVVVGSGSAYESETLYYLVETAAPDGYLLPLEPDNIYFYFCNDTYLIPSILADLPEGETAVNLSETYDSLFVDNQKEKVNIPVMKTWQGNVWPGEIDRVEIGLYQSVDGSEPVPVTDDQDEPRTVVLRKMAPYNDRAFTNLPARNEDQRPITYSIREEHVYTAADQDVLSEYVQEYGVSDAGVYIVRNKEAAALTVRKEWVDLTGQTITDPNLLAEEPDVTFDVYRTTNRISAEISADGITNGEMAAFVSGMKPVRTNLRFGHGDDWTMTVSDLDKKDNFGNLYCYYVLESVPSFGTELYEVDEDNRTVTITNHASPEPVSVTVRKAALVNDPRPEAAGTEFAFTLALKKDSHVIRNWKVGEDGTDTLETDWNGEARFMLRPEESITLSLPPGVTATVTEDAHAEYVQEMASGDLTDLETSSGRIIRFEVTEGADGALITCTNTLRVICKVTDLNGVEHPFEALKSALAHVRENPDLYPGPVTVEMLEDYAMPSTDVFDVRAGEEILLTTAATSGTEFPFRTDRTEDTFTAIITRAGAGGSMLTDEGSLTLENLVLDGAKDTYTASGSGGLVSVSGTLNLRDGAVLRNSAAADMGGAIYSAGEVYMEAGTSLTGNSALVASAVYLAEGSLYMTGGRISGNSGASDGAVSFSNTTCRIFLSGDPVIHENTNRGGDPANIYIGLDSDTIINVIAPGLGSGALIGVTATEGHREISEQFATAEYEVTANLDRFINDTYDYRGRLKDGTSTNIVWDGLSLQIRKVLDGSGTDERDTFTLTLTSPSIRRSNYTIDGTVDYTITPARQNTPGSIVMRNVRKDDLYSISPLPVGTYTLTEAASHYAPEFTGVNDESGQAIAAENGTFQLQANSTVTVTNRRRLARVRLTKALQDRLVGSEEAAFPFTVQMTEADGRAISGFSPADGLTTDRNGRAVLEMSPTNTRAAVRVFEVPVGAVMQITEDADSSRDYRITASALTIPSTGGGQEIADENTDDDHIFAFSVTDDGADVSFANERKMAVIDLVKEVAGKVSAEESFTMTVTLTRKAGGPAADYALYEDPDDPARDIVTDEDGKALITFDMARDVSSKSVTLTIPEGTGLTVEETPVTRMIGGAQREIYTTASSINGGAARAGLRASIPSVSDDDRSIVFTNTRRTQTVTVKNTVSGYSGNTIPFTFTASVTDGAEDDYDENGFADGRQVFELATGESRVLTVPYGAALRVAESFVIGYETTVKRGGAAEVTASQDEFVVTADETLSFTNTQLINLVLDNRTSSEVSDVRVYVSTSTKMYRVNDSLDGQDPVPLTNRTATVTVEAGKKAILEVEYNASQTYTVSGSGHDDYYMTILNEPSYHEDSNPAVMRVYNSDPFSVSGKLRYGPADSTVTFTEQPLVTFDVNGGVWTTEMEGFHDRDGGRRVYQRAVETGERVEAPEDPVYHTAEGIEFMGWTWDRALALAGHSAGEDVSADLYDFSAPVEGPLTLYAVWSKEERDGHVVTLENASGAALSCTVTLTAGNTAVAGWQLAEGLTTNAGGQVNLSLAAGESINLALPQGAKAVISASSPAGIRAYSTDYTDADSQDLTFTINPVDRDGTVTYISGICKITDADGNLLYERGGRPAVYMTLQAAFTAYEGNLYGNASGAGGTLVPAAVKMLVDDYAIGSKHPFPRRDLILTTAGKDDADFPYTGVRTRATLYRDAAYNNDSLFTHERSATSVTITDIILDGNDVPFVTSKNINGSLIYVGYAGAALNITTGAVLRNVRHAAYTNQNGAVGGAVYVYTNGTLNVDAGLFSDLHARRGGAICATGNAVVHISGRDGSTRFENCSTSSNNNNSNGADGGAIYYTGTSPLVIDGGQDRDHPGILFDSCRAESIYGDGGALCINSAADVSVSGCTFTECSARTTSGDRYFGGGAIAGWNMTGLHIGNSTFISCDTLKSGGAVMARIANDKAVEFENCAFENCNCAGQGGAVAVYQLEENTQSLSSLQFRNCSFRICTAGTVNGSGGAIQSYLPIMSLESTTFTDCWAGKEGGAINQFYASGDGLMWYPSEMSVIDCSFVRCRAEDRYQPENTVHFGGGIATKAVTLVVQRSHFEDCVSTLRQGGAIHCSGKGSSDTIHSSATIEDSSFVRCSAKTNGGALLASTETLTIRRSSFEGCSSFTENGGAIYHGQTVSGGSVSWLATELSDCTFTSSSAAGSGGAVWTRAEAVKLDSCSIDDCAAAGNGGGFYLERVGNQEALITGGSITGCRAKNGSAVHVSMPVTLSGVLVSGNTVSEVNSGAVHGGTLYFEGNTRVEDNDCSADSAYKHDVLLQNNNATTIRTTQTGLGPEAHIGVYVTDAHLNNRGVEGKDFGTHGSDAYLESFFNDRYDNLYGYRMNDNGRIYWGIYVCKITDADGNTLVRPNGRDAVYQKLELAFGEFTSVTGGEPVYVKMLVEDYNIQNTGNITNFPAADLTLTTAGADDPDHPYRGTPGTVCTISRNNSSNQLFSLNNVNATFRLENITLDGRRDKTADAGTFRLIQASHGALIIQEGTTLQYGMAGNPGGGAIYAQNADAPVTIYGACDADSGEAKVRFINCGATGDYNGGAIFANRLTIVNSSDAQGQYGTAFIDCTAARGGAVCVNGTVMQIEGASCTNCHCNYEGGAFYHNNNGNNSTRIVNCAFEGCFTGQPGVNGSAGNDWSYGGAVTSKVQNLEVRDSIFRDCYALSDGGAVNHGAREGNRTSTILENNTFTNCRTTGNYNDYAHGGAFYSRANRVEVTACAFDTCTAKNSGGALYTYSNANNSALTISGSSFQSCRTDKNNSSGGAVSTRARTATLRDHEDKACSFAGCRADGSSGAIHMETNSSTLHIGGSTTVSGCYARQGGAIYLRSGVTMNLTDSPAFTRNGYMAVDGTVLNAQKGACIYLEQGSRINLSGSPRFSRNILTDQARLINGGLLDYVRQDLYLAGYSGTKAASIHVAGELTGDTIWIWPEQSPHRLPNEQFATTASNVSAASLEKLRNSLADSTTGCSNGEYLAGVRLPGQDDTNVYWDKMYNISFKKIDNKAVAVPGAEFTLYTDKACTAGFAGEVSADGTTDTNAQGELLAKGTVDFTSVPIGIYYMKETVVPESFKENDTVYLVLVGSPALSPNEYNRELWEAGGPLDVPNAATLVARHTTNSGRYYGIFPLDEDGRADLSKNLASANVGITNIRNDYEAEFMKEDDAGAALPHAAFTIYVQETDAAGQERTYDNGYPVLTLWSRDGENYPEPAEAADGSTGYRKLDGTTVPRGVVYFRELPIGTYYLLESYYPDRNGSNRQTFYVESDRVLRLEVMGEEGFALSQWQEDGTYVPLEMEDGYYLVQNTVAVCKLTDDHDRLLYELGHDGQTLFPAIYASLEAGFAAAKTHALYDAQGQAVADDSLHPSLKLKALRDFTLSEPVVYDSPRPLTLTTAERTARASDRYIFTTNRTTDTQRAQISRAYSADNAEDANAGALITIAGGADLTLQNIKLDGQKSRWQGRAVHVTEEGSLTVLNNTLLQNFRQEAPAGSSGEDAVRGGAVLLDDGTSLTVDGGSANRSAVFSGNEVNNKRTDQEAETGSFGGAVAIGKNCAVSFANAQFTGNKANAAADGQGKGGAVCIEETEDAEDAAVVALRNVVFRTNTAAGDGGSLYAAGRLSLAASNCTFTGGTAQRGGAVYVSSPVELTLTGGSMRSGRADTGGAIYAEDGSIVTATSAAISGNTGGALYAAGPDTRLWLGGSVSVYGNLDRGAQKNVVLGQDTNEIIRTTDQGLTLSARIGVYVEDGEAGELFTAHGLAGKPFGTFAGAQNLAAFVNDRNGALYGVRSDQDETDTLIYWVSSGLSVAFKKTDGYGSPLAGAAFTLYADQACTDPFQKGPGESATALSADGTTAKNLSGNLLEKGTVLFEEIPEGVYYMKETDTGNNAGAPDGFRENTHTYILLAGAGTMTRPANTADTIWDEDGVLARITQDMVDAQSARYTQDKAQYSLTEDALYAIFRIDDEPDSPDYGRAAATPDLSRYGILNISQEARRAILKKIDSNTLAPVEGASFEIFRADMTKMEWTAGNLTVSGADGVFFIGDLPCGTYYLHESSVPDGYQSLEEGDNWYTVTVNADGVGSLQADDTVKNRLQPQGRGPQ